MGCENFDIVILGEHTRQPEAPASDPVTWPGAYATTDRGGDIPAKVKEYHEYWEPTVGPQWYQLPRGR